MRYVDIELRTSGTERLLRLAAAIRDAGEAGITRELEKSLKKLERPLVRSAREGAVAILPYRGGLAERVAASRFSSSVRLTATGVTMTITGLGRRGTNLSRMDERGLVRHPVYADADKPRQQWHWVTQRVPPGWFSKPLELDAPKIRQEIEDGIDRLADQLEARGG